MNRTLTACMAFLVVLLVSCVQPESSAQPVSDSFDLDGTEWVLESLDGQPLVEGTNITLEFDDGRLGGYAGCNMYGSPYTATETTLKVESIYSDAQGCVGPVGQQEEAYHRALYGAATYRFANDHLELANGAGDVTLVFIQQPQLPMNPADLVGTKWRLRAVSGEAISAHELVTLNFPAAGVFNGVLGCIDYHGTYTAEGDDIWFGEYGHDYARCRGGEELDGVEAELMVSGVTDYRLNGSELELLTYTGDTLLFTAR